MGCGENIIVETIRTSRCSFDVSLSGLKEMKAAGISDNVIAVMLSANSAMSQPSAQPALMVDPNDPRGPQDAGNWLYEEDGGKPKMTQLEPSVCSQNKTGVMFFAQFGQTAKSLAVIGGAHAELSTGSREPIFYFYFEHMQAGLGDPKGATSANEYILSRFEVNEKEFVPT
jgi:hypothetical protein